VTGCDWSPRLRGQPGGGTGSDQSVEVSLVVAETEVSLVAATSRYSRGQSGGGSDRPVAS
jgi:hypothetical protein